MADQPPASWKAPPRKNPLKLGGLGGPFSAQENADRRVAKWNELSAAEKDTARAANKAAANAATAAAAAAERQRQDAANAAANAAAYADDSEPGKLLRIRRQFKTDVVDKTLGVLQQFKHVTIPFLVEAGKPPFDDIRSVIGFYITNGNPPPATIEGERVADGTYTEGSAMDAAHKVTKDDLINVLLYKDPIRTLSDELKDIKFETKNGKGKLNLSANANPFRDDPDSFIQLLKCCYGEPKPQPCVREKRTVYAYMTLLDAIDEGCITAILSSFIERYPPGDELCGELAEAAEIQEAEQSIDLPPGPAGGAGGPPAGAASPRERQGGGSRSRYSRSSRRKGRGRSYRMSRRH